MISCPCSYYKQRLLRERCTRTVFIHEFHDVKQVNKNCTFVQGTFHGVFCLSYILYTETLILVHSSEKSSFPTRDWTQFFMCEKCCSGPLIGSNSFA